MKNPGGNFTSKIQVETDKKPANRLKTTRDFLPYGRAYQDYVPGKSDPMALILSHTWQDRWSDPGYKSNIIVYSNCDEMELFNKFLSGNLDPRENRNLFPVSNVNVGYSVL